MTLPSPLSPVITGTRRKCVSGRPARTGDRFRGGWFATDDIGGWTQPVTSWSNQDGTRIVNVAGSKVDTSEFELALLIARRKACE